MLTSGNRTMTPWQAVWYVLGVVTYPVAVGLVGLGCIRLGMSGEAAFCVAMFGLPFVWLPLHQLLMREAERRSRITIPLKVETDAPTVLLETRPLIR